MSRAERLARVGLSRVSEPDDAELRAAISSLGAVETWELLRAEDARLPVGLRQRTAARVEAAAPETDLRQLASLGARLVCPGDPEWPPALDDLGPWAPLVLWLRGPADLASVGERSVAVVGSRAATDYGLSVAGEMGAGLGERGWAVVSGGALGIDGAAHRGALAVGATTVAVLACGVDVVYPQRHEALLARIAERGLVVSEWPPVCQPMRHRFLTRNRVIAALAGGTVVVEAAIRSGALSTAKQAEQLGRVVMAVPGPVTSAMSGGCHRWLREHDAVLVTDAAEVVEAVGRIGADLAPRPSGPVTLFDELPPVAQRVRDALPATRWAPVASVVRTSGLALSDVLEGLSQLELAGLAEHVDGRYRCARPGRGA